MHAQEDGQKTLQEGWHHGGKHSRKGHVLDLVYDLDTHTTATDSSHLPTFYIPVSVSIANEKSKCLFNVRLERKTCCIMKG